MRPGTPGHCKTCRCQYGPWTVRVEFPNGGASKSCESRDEAIQWAQREIEGYVPMDWFHKATISITFGTT